MSNSKSELADFNSLTLCDDDIKKMDVTHNAYQDDDDTKTVAQDLDDPSTGQIENKITVETTYYKQVEITELPAGSTDDDIITERCRQKKLMKLRGALINTHTLNINVQRFGFNIEALNKTIEMLRMFPNVSTTRTQIEKAERARQKLIRLQNIAYTNYKETRELFFHTYEFYPEVENYETEEAMTVVVFEETRKRERED